jgi:hypothetical protein
MMIRLEPKIKSKGLKRTPLKRKLRIYNPITKNYYPVKPAEKSAKPIKSLWRTPLKSMSKKMQKQRREEDKLSLKLAELSGNRCEICGNTYNLHKHEIIKRSHQGNETDPMNCLLLCLTCHDHRKYPKSGTPLSIEEQLALAKRLHSNLIKEQ